jgi:hypothetical protein
MSTTWMGELNVAAWSVVLAISPLAALFLIFQVFLLKLPRRQVADILSGTAISAIGLFLFLLGVNVGFLPFGRIVGESLGALGQPWLAALIGLLLGLVITWGEPAVRILADQVEEASNGSIRKSLVLYAICIGVAFSVGLGMLRIGYEIPLLYVLVPGYLLIIGLMWLSDRDFLSIAVDAGGVATGPLANTFLLALALGASASVDDRQPLIHGFGFVALIAVAPVVPIMVLGFLIRPRSRAKKEQRRC